MVLGLFGLTLGLAACPGDDGEGTGTDGDTDPTSTTAMTTTPMTTSPSTSATTPTTDMTPTPMTTDMTTDVTSDTATDTDPSATDTDTTGGRNTCSACIEENCGDELAACAGVKDCNCWIECTAGMGTEKECAEECGGPPPMRFADFFACIGRNCVDDCSDDDTTTGGADGMYQACEMQQCPDDLTCATNLNICTIPCESPDDCPAPVGSDAEVDCSPVIFHCLLRCNNGETCPPTTECNDFNQFDSICSAT